MSLSLYETVTDVQTGADVVARRRYGVIETVAGELRRIVYRPYPKFSTEFGIRTFGRWAHRLLRGNRCRLYFNQPWSCPTFLALQYVETTRDADYATFRRALTTLDDIARLKRIDALVCDASNLKISDRFLARLGWEAHAPMPGHRNFIKRFR